jgi:hypothetical protein
MFGKMLTLLFAASGLLFSAFTAQRQNQNANSIVGRWDLTVQSANATYPSWLEVTREGDKLAGRFVGRTGSARPLQSIEITDGQITFTFGQQVYKGRLVGNKLEGTIEGRDGGMLKWTGVRAPEIKPPARPQWGQPIQLFNGRDMTGWRQRDGKTGCWSVVDGTMTNTPPCVDIITEQKFKDFKLHVEFNMVEKSNSGVYLRGRYEVQIQDDFGKPPAPNGIGGLYGFITPVSNAAKKAGEWQTYDITILGRQVTVVLNGQTIIDKQEIPGITGGALDSDEAAAGPIMLQGDHGKVSFRNIVLTPVK